MLQFFELPNLLKNFTLELDSFLKFAYLLSRICFYISVVAIPFYILAFFSSLLSILDLSELVELFSGGLGQFIAIAVLPVVVIALEYLLRKKILGVIREGFQRGEFNKAMKYLRKKYIHSKEKPDSEHQTAGQGGQNEQNAKRNEREEDLSGFVLSVVSDFVEDVLKSIKIQRLLFAILLALFSNLFVYPLSVLAFLKYIHFDIPLAELGGVVGIFAVFFAVAYLLLFITIYIAVPDSDGREKTEKPSSGDEEKTEKKLSLITFLREMKISLRSLITISMSLLSSFYGFPVKIRIPEKRRKTSLLKCALILLIFADPFLPFLGRDRHLESSFPTPLIYVFTIKPDELSSDKLDKLLGNYKYLKPSKESKIQDCIKNKKAKNDYLLNLGIISCAVLSRYYCPRFSIKIEKSGIIYIPESSRGGSSGGGFFGKLNDPKLQYRNIVLGKYLQWLSSIQKKVVESAGNTKVIFKSFKELELDEEKSLNLAEYFTIPDYQVSADFGRYFNEELIELLGRYGENAVLAVPHLYVGGENVRIPKEIETEIKSRTKKAEKMKFIEIEAIFTLPVLSILVFGYE
jgi:hypothetical protein